MAVSGLEQKFMRIQFGGKTRLRIYRKLVRFVANGVPMTTALETLWKFAVDNKRKVEAAVLEDWLANTRNGRPLGVAIQKWVPQQDRIVIEAGETAGKLVDAIENACLLYESQRRIRGAVLAGVLYPLVLVGIAIVFMVMFGTQVVPAFDEILPREQWTGVGAQMAAMSDFVNVGLVPLLTGLAGLGVLVAWSMPRWTGKLRSRVDDFPPYSLYRLVAGSGFLLSVAALVKAGVKITNILRILQRDAGPWYAERMTKTLAHVNNGLDIGDALHKTGLNFPDKETVNDLRAYAKLEDFDEMLMRLGKENLDDTVTRIQAQSAMLRNVGIVILGLVFAWIAIGIFDLQNQMTAGM
jgi:Type II secretory pathway, component PulF